MKKLLLVFTLFLCLGFSTQSFAQCSEFETEVILVLQTDNYGAEVYWEVDLQGFIIASGGCEDIKPGGLRLQGELAGCDGVYETGTYVIPICIPTGSEVTFNNQKHAQPSPTNTRNPGHGRLIHHISTNVEREVWP